MSDTILLLQFSSKSYSTDRLTRKPQHFHTFSQHSFYFLILIIPLMRYLKPSIHVENNSSVTFTHYLRLSTFTHCLIQFVLCFSSSGLLPKYQLFVVCPSGLCYTMSNALLSRSSSSSRFWWYLNCHRCFSNFSYFLGIGFAKLNISGMRWIIQVLSLASGLFTMWDPIRILYSAGICLRVIQSYSTP